MDKKIYLSKKNKKIGGVCGGFGEYFDVDPTIIRVLFLIGVVVGGAGVLIYLLSWLIIPLNPNID